MTTYNVITGSGFDDAIAGSSGSDYYYGGNGNDTLTTGAGSAIDNLYGGAGNDTFELVAGTTNATRIRDFNVNEDILDVSDWGASFFSDLTITTTASGQTYVSYGDNSVQLRGFDNSTPLTTDSFVYFGSQDATTGNDTLVGTEFDDVIDADAGNDILVGSAGLDYYYGGQGDDRLINVAGKDVANLYGGQGSDTFELVEGSTNATRIRDFVQGDDMLDVSDWGATQFSDLTIKTTGSGNTYVSYDGNSVQLRGFDNSAPLTVDSFVFAIADVAPEGGGGAFDPNPIVGNGYVYGTSGNDMFTNEAGSELNNLFGGAGADTFKLVAGTTNATRIRDFDATQDSLDISEWGAVSFDDLDIWTTASGNTYVSYEGNSVQLRGFTDAAALNSDNIELTNFVYGDTFSNSMHGSVGTDKIYGLEGDDILIGGSGSDYLYGGDGQDLLITEAGDTVDHLYGGSGIDTFVFVQGTTTSTRVRDYEAEDVLVVFEWGINSFNDLTIETSNSGHTTVSFEDNAFQLRGFDNSDPLMADDFIF